MFKKWWFWVIVVVVLFVIVGTCTSPESEKVTEEIPSYSIAEINDISYGNVKRFEYNVVIPEEVTPEQMKLVVKDVVDKAKKGEKFNAIVVMMYDYPEYIGYGYTLGRVVFAPDGDWSKADTVEAGDYNKMKFGWLELRNKDWTKRLTKKEVEIWKTWQDKAEEESKSSELLDEDEITKWVAQKFGISPDDVTNILIKQSEWLSSNITIEKSTEDTQEDSKFNQLFEEGKKLIEEDHLTDGISKLLEAKKIKSNEEINKLLEDAYFERGEYFFNQKEYEKAKADLSKVSPKSENYTKAKELLDEIENMYVEQILKEYEDAINKKDYTTAVSKVKELEKNYPNYPELWKYKKDIFDLLFDIALSETKKDNLDSAKIYVNQCLSIYPTSTKAKTLYTRIMMQYFEGSDSLLIAFGGFEYKHSIGYSNAPTGYKFACFYIAVKNISPSTIHVNPNYLTLVDSKGYAYGYSSATFEFSTYFDAVDLPPESKNAGWIAFQIREDGKPIKIIYDDKFTPEIQIDVTDEYWD